MQRTLLNIDETEIRFIMNIQKTTRELIWLFSLTPIIYYLKNY